MHLHGVHNSSMKRSVQWMEHVDQSHSQGELRLVNNEIVIPRSGLYFVYSQASFRVDCRSSNADDSSMVHLSHTVKRWSKLWAEERSDESYRTILHSMRTACQRTGDGLQQDGKWYTAVYMGAVFNLERDDHLSTWMEEEMLNMLEDDEGKTYFGVFAL
ncbi:unnamed protein product [Ophioblennius macclurei]